MITRAMVAELSGAYGGRADQQAYLDLAQEHFLDWLLSLGAFSGGQMAFKGGTALRKFKFGSRGRFSTDLDFWTADAGLADTIIGMLNEGVVHHEVRFALVGEYRDTGTEKHASWLAEASQLGETQESSGLDFSTRHRFRAMSTPATRPPLGIGADMKFRPPLVPIYDLLENVSEKLARVRRRCEARDLYDLSLIGAELTAEDLPVIRRLTAFKVFFDKHEGMRLPEPFRGGLDFTSLDPDEVLNLDDIGRLAGRRMPAKEMCDKVSLYFGRMGPPVGDLETRLAACGPADLLLARSKLDAWSSGL